jgi:glycosyltransferase involved in cell wall biosynthesis
MNRMYALKDLDTLVLPVRTSGATRMASKNRHKIAVFVSFSGRGGAERMMLNLSEGLVALGCQVDLVLVKGQDRLVRSVARGVRVVKLGPTHTMSSLPALIRYLRRERPCALLSVKDRANQVAILAKRLAGVSTRVVVRMGTTVSAALKVKSRLHHMMWYYPMRLLYPLADAIVAVSDGVAADLAAITGLPVTRFPVIPNPVVTPRIAALAREAVTHPWFAEGEVPVILGVGRLTRQKDFPTLLRAFAAVRQQRACRLVILGEGGDRPLLEALAGELGVERFVDLPGFVDNPYAYMSKAALFVLSSLWEGSPNALTEALAVGTPVVATDCPSGPGEILAGGHYGPLVPVGDADALAGAVLAMLRRPPGRNAPAPNAVSAYTTENSSRRYLEVLLPETEQD